MLVHNLIFVRHAEGDYSSCKGLKRGIYCSRSIERNYEVPADN